MGENGVGNADELGRADADAPSAVRASGPAESPASRQSGPDDAARAEGKSGLEEQLIERIPIAALKPRARNARRHPRKQVEQLAASIREFGFIGAVIADQENNLLAGHGRLEAARLAGLTAIDCIRVRHLDEARKVAFALADNRMSELSAWDDELLKLELKELESVANLDLELTGFDTVDLDRLLGPEPDPNGADDEIVPEPELDKPAVSQRGDIWILGEHRLLCEDALKPENYTRLLQGERAAQVLTDPPYNVRVGGHVSSKGFREFAMGSGEMTPPQFTDFISTFLEHCRSVARDGAIFHVFMDWRHIQEITAGAQVAKLTLKNVCVWVKPSSAMGFYCSQHEFVFVLKHGTAPHVDNFGLGARGRKRSNVWHYPAAVHGKRRGVADPDYGHPTPKPVSLIVDALKDCSNRGDIVLDPFAGSGTLAIAAERIGRRARMMELDPHYVDLCVRRWEAVTGQTARLSTGETFAQVRSTRTRAGQALPDDVGGGAEQSHG